VLLGSQRVVPKRARELGFRFHHPNLTEALRSILR
jgi:NAD dependent epimerase/dehydratase family enzyme